MNYEINPIQSPRRQPKKPVSWTMVIIASAMSIMAVCVLSVVAVLGYYWIGAVNEAAARDAEQARWDAMTFEEKQHERWNDAREQMGQPRISFEQAQENQKENIRQAEIRRSKLKKKIEKLEY